MALGTRHYGLRRPGAAGFWKRIVEPLDEVPTPVSAGGGCSSCASCAGANSCPSSTSI